MTTDPAAPAPRWRAAAKPEAPSLFLLVFAAIPRQGGGIRPVLAFAQGADLEAALRRALDGLSADGWSELDLEGAKALPDDPLAEPDEMARSAIERALERGFSYLAYR